MLYSKKLSVILSLPQCPRCEWDLIVIAQFCVSNQIYTFYFGKQVSCFVEIWIRFTRLLLDKLSVSLSFTLLYYPLLKVYLNENVW